MAIGSEERGGFRCLASGEEEVVTWTEVIRSMMVQLMHKQGRTSTLAGVALVGIVLRWLWLWLRVFAGHCRHKFSPTTNAVSRGKVGG